MSTEEIVQSASQGNVLPDFPSGNQIAPVPPIDKNPVSPDPAYDPWTQLYIEALEAGICWI